MYFVEGFEAYKLVRPSEGLCRGYKTFGPVIDILK